MSPLSPDPAERPPHPLALSLIVRLQGRAGLRVLEIGAGSGRNTRALEAAGLEVVALEGPTANAADAAVSTHALLHGGDADIAALLDHIADRLEPGAPLYGTFGSVRDARMGLGTRLGPFTFAPEGGDERGIAHTYFDDARLRAMLEGRFAIEVMEERSVDEIAGKWAHEERPLSGAVHWFVIAVKR